MIGSYKYLQKRSRHVIWILATMEELVLKMSTDMFATAQSAGKEDIVMVRIMKHFLFYMFLL